VSAWRDRILALGPCSDAREWLETVPDDWTAEQAWGDCERGDWMLWLAGRLGVDRVAIARVACAVARSVLHLVPAGEDRPRLAIEAAEAWCDEPSPEAAWAACAAGAAAWAAAAATSHRAIADVVRSALPWSLVEERL
jgi:hypothetical protein